MEVLDEKDGRAESPVVKNTFIIHKDGNLWLSDERNDNVAESQLTFDGVDTCY